MSMIRRSALVAAGILVVSVGVAAVQRSGHLTDPNLSERAFQVILGLLVVWQANGVPKHLPPLGAGACTPAEGQSIRRFVGMSLFLGGLGYAGVWLLAPMGVAPTLSMAVLGATLFLGVGRCVQGRLTPRTR